MKKSDKRKTKILITITLLTLFIILILFYFSFLTVVTTDSTGYYRSFDVIRGNTPIQSWQLVRGPTMPLIIYIFTTIFGDTSIGFLLGTFLFYLITIYIGYLLISEILKKQKNKTIKTSIWVLFILLFIFNPLIIGYYHVMLTEFVAMTFSLITIYLSTKWIDINPLKEKKKFVLFTFFFIIISILMWFLKQPYVVVALIPISLGTLLSILKHKDRFNTIWKTSIFIICLVGIVGGIKIWDEAFLTKAGGSSSDTVDSALTKGFIDALSNFREIEEDEIETYIDEGKHLDNEEKKLIEEIDNGESEYTGYRLFKVLTILRTDVIDILVIPTSTEYSNYRNVYSIIETSFKKYPANFIMSYISNYASMINLVPYNYKSLNPKKRFFKPDELRGENENIGLAIYFRESTFLGGASKKGEQMRQYEMPNPSLTLPEYITNFLTKLYPIYLMTITLLIAPILFIVLTVIYLTKKTVRDGKQALLYESMILLSGYASLHVLFHSITGATVDRYSIVGYPSAIIASILLINFLKVRK